MVVDRPEAFENFLELVSQWDELTPKEHKVLVERFTELLQPHGFAPTPLHQVLSEAAQRAGWTLPSVKAQQRQRTAARARTNQREEDLEIRWFFVAGFFKKLRPDLQAKPGSTATAQAMLGRLQRLRLPRRPPMTIRTIQADILFLRRNAPWTLETRVQRA